MMIWLMLSRWFMGSFLMVSGCNLAGSEAYNLDAGVGPEIVSQEASSVLAWVSTKPAALEPEGYAHTEVVRISRDFGKETFEIVIDAWVPHRAPTTIADVRMWWFKKPDGERGPFSKKTQKHFFVEYKQLAADRWHVVIVAKRKRFVLTVSLDDLGVPVALADVATGARYVRGCKVNRGRIVAKRFLGAPVGIRHMDLSCTDDSKTQIEGRLRPL